METVEEERVVGILHGVAAELGMPLFEWSVTRGLTKDGGALGIHSTVEPLALLKHLEGLTVEAIFLLKDFVGQLADAGVARQMRELCERFSHTRSSVVLCGATIALPRELDTLAVHYLVRMPEHGELRSVIETVGRSLGQSGRVKVTLTSDELDGLADALSGMTLNQARQAVAYAALEDGCLSAADRKTLLERKAEKVREGGLLEYFPAEDSRWELGGFARLKDWLARARTGFSSEAQAIGLAPPRGILLVGVQGCGKSLAAKVIAREWGIPLLKLDAGRLFDKYVGESEKNFRKATELAESMAPVVLWIDEIEKALVPTGMGEADGGLSRRLFASFLTWLQEKKSEVFVVATANDVFVLPPELMRKGRFDEIFFVDLPDPDERRQILKIHLTLRKQDLDAFDANALVTATDGMSGAEIEQAVIAALYRSLHRKSPLDTAGLLEELRATVPLSVSRREDISRLRSTAAGRFVPVR
jgi:MoxR-like ATPase